MPKTIDPPKATARHSAQLQRLLDVQREQQHNLDEAVAAGDDESARKCSASLSHTESEIASQRRLLESAERGERESRDTAAVAERSRLVKAAERETEGLEADALAFEAVMQGPALAAWRAFQQRQERWRVAMSAAGLSTDAAMQNGADVYRPAKVWQIVMRPFVRDCGMGDVTPASKSVPFETLAQRMGIATATTSPPKGRKSAFFQWLDKMKGARS